MDFLQLDHNQFLSGGLVLMIVGGVLYYLKRIPGILYDLVERFFIVKIEILDDDEAYQWMQVWLAKRLRKNLSVSVLTKRNNPRNPDEEEPVNAGKIKPTIHLVPAVGIYYFRYRGCFVTLSRDRQENNTPLSPGGEASVSMLRNKESFTLRIFSRDRDLARILVEECRDRAIPDDDKVDIMIANFGYWQVGTRVRPRPVASVILDRTQADELRADMTEFLASRNWYRAIGVPYRRGYLLYGPPGNGKTSVVKALAGELNMSIYLMMLSDRDMNDSRINELLAKVPEKSILLLEDIDCAFIQRKKNSNKDGVTFSGLLNALDGVASAEGRIIVMTTNYIERLDPALIRPGRADVKLAFENATADQARRLFERFFPDYAHRTADFADAIEDRQFSMATLQDYLMLHRSDPEAAIGLVAEIGKLQINSAAPRTDRACRENGRPLPV
jgi:mitochondrial chaperone BCS1